MTYYGKIDSNFNNITAKFSWEFDSLPEFLFCPNNATFTDIQQITSEISMFRPPENPAFQVLFTLISDGKNGFFKAEIEPKPIKIKYFYTPNEKKYFQGSALRWRESTRTEISSGLTISGNKIKPSDFEKLFKHNGSLCAEICIMAFDSSVEKPRLGERLMEMWRDDASMKFIIKCEDREFEVFKPIMFACSPFFKAMFDSPTFNESMNNCVTIANFKANIVEKMIEFCVTDNIEYDISVDINDEIINFDFHEEEIVNNETQKQRKLKLAKFEDDIFKIAHFYQINELLKFIVKKMKLSIHSSNVETRLKMAEFYENEELTLWCLNYAKFLEKQDSLSSSFRQLLRRYKHFFVTE